MVTVSFDVCDVIPEGCNQPDRRGARTGALTLAFARTVEHGGCIRVSVSDSKRARSRVHQWARHHGLRARTSKVGDVVYMWAERIEDKEA